jgi:hypothetical protein
LIGRTSPGRLIADRSNWGAAMDSSHLTEHQNLITSITIVRELVFLKPVRVHGQIRSTPGKETHLLHPLESHQANCPYYPRDTLTCEHVHSIRPCSVHKFNYAYPIGQARGCFQLFCFADTAHSWISNGSPGTQRLTSTPFEQSLSFSLHA